MSLKDELNLLKSSISCCGHNGAQHTHIVINEPDPSAKLKQVTLRVPSGEWFSFFPDKGRGKQALMSPLLSIGKEYNHHRACDCVVFLEKNNILTAIYIDLKSGNPTGYSSQFQSTRQFVRYMLGLLEEFHSHKFILNERYVVLWGGKSSVSINKTLTSPKLNKKTKTSPTNPLKMEIRNRSIMYLKQLLS